MRVNIDWLRDWVRLDGTAEAVAADLTAAGLEVDSIEPAGQTFSNVVVASVLSTERHPNADRLSVCRVDDGHGTHQVVCGAPNVAAGIKVPFARVGAALPGGKAIGAAKLRGVESQGMLCSAKELGLPDDVDGLLILGGDAPLGTPLEEHLKLEDAILEINVTPNRGDCFSVLGIARELAARRREGLADPLAPPARCELADMFPVELRAGDRCPRFVGRLVKGLDPNARTPLWMRERLRRAGLRAIQPVVDVTNYVMLELGQPLHAYDATKLEGHIEARLGARGEALTLLDGRSIDLDDDLLVIADARGPVGLAGVMGGESSAVSEATTEIFLEAAFFAPAAIAGRARRFGLHTDASLRFERGVDPTGQERAIERATELLLAISGGEAGPLVVAERRGDIPRRATVALRRDRLSSVLGLTIADERVTAILNALGMQVEFAAEGWHVVAPPFRFDIAIEEDLIEEVSRMYGYDAIPVTPADVIERLGTAPETAVDANRLIDTLVARGYTEAITYSFIDDGLEQRVNPGSEAVVLENPIASDMAVLRRSLWPGLISVAQLNLSRQRQRMKLFELGPQFTASDGKVEQTTVLAGIALGERSPEHWDGAAAPLDFYDVKCDVEALLQLTGRADDFRFETASHPALSPGRTARIFEGKHAIGWLGALHPDLQNRLDKRRVAIVFALQVDRLDAEIPAFKEFSKFPSIRRDLAIVVDENVTADTLQRLAYEAAGGVLQSATVFDVYRGQGVESRRKSIALGLILQDVSRTLTDEDADRTMRSVMLHLERECGATIRT
jgi:phenylalanyl-tRNA synthetase beta chain